MSCGLAAGEMRQLFDEKQAVQALLKLTDQDLEAEPHRHSDEGGPHQEDVKAFLNAPLVDDDPELEPAAVLRPPPLLVTLGYARRAP